MYQSLLSLQELLYISSSTAAGNTTFTKKWVTSKQNPPNPNITQKSYPRTAKHSSDVPHLFTCSQKVNICKKNRNPVIPHLLNPLASNARINLIPILTFSAASYAKHTSVSRPPLFIRSPPAPHQPRILTPQRNLNTPASSTSRLSVSLSRQQQTCTRTYLFLFGTLRLFSRCTHHTDNKSTGSPAAHKGHIKSDIKRVSLFKSFCFYPLPTRKLYLYLSQFL